jgi:o-succinylbenzoate synthase
MKANELRCFFAQAHLPFKGPMTTSRGSLLQRDINYLFVTTDTKHWGVGEIAPLPGLSIDEDIDLPRIYGEVFAKINDNVINGRDPWEQLEDRWPSVSIGIYMALFHLNHGGLECTYDDILSSRILSMEFPPEQWIIHDCPLTRGEEGIQINGLVWMGTLEEMKARAQAKIDAGYRCIKVKIGGIRFEEELELLRYIRAQRTPQQLELRVDANGAFTPEEAPEKLRRLAEFGIHSIEQPIRAGQWEAMAELVRTSPIPIALDEELIGQQDHRKELFDTIQPNYLILKPTLIGASTFINWMNDMRNRELGDGFWITSALESNVGLNFLAQTVSYLKELDPQLLQHAQGLGTGQLFACVNWTSIPLKIEGDCLYFNKKK